MRWHKCCSLQNLTNEQIVWKPCIEELHSLSSAGPAWTPEYFDRQSLELRHNRVAAFLKGMRLQNRQLELELCQEDSSAGAHAFHTKQPTEDAVGLKKGTERCGCMVYLHVEDTLELGEVGVAEELDVVVDEGVRRVVRRHDDLEDHFRLRHPLHHDLRVTSNEKPDQSRNRGGTVEQACKRHSMGTDDALNSLQ